MAAIFEQRRTRAVAVLQFQREHHFSFTASIFARNRAERIFRQAMARVASTVSRNDRHNVRAARAGHIKLGVSRVAAGNLTLDYRRANCICVVDDLFFRYIIPQRAKNYITR
jgi:hypothetical protein